MMTETTDSAAEPEPTEPEDAPTAEDVAAAETSGLSPQAARQVRRDAAVRVERDELRGRIELLAAQVTAFQTAEVTRLLARQVADPDAALRLADTDVADLLAEDGTVNAEAVEVLADGLIEAYPMLRPPRTGTYDDDIGAKRNPVPQRPKATWAGLMARR